jgi:glycosyltransferase involved in cell wall biosynthesis
VVRDAARSRLGFEPRVIHLASFGLVDSRTKMSNVVVEAAAWLTQWGHSVALHMVGGASEADIELLTTQASSAGLHSFSVTGFVPDAEFRDYLLAIDIGIQLRVSPLLGVSGPLSDVAAFGTPAVASSGLAIDVDAPEYVYRLPDQVSAVTVAEAIEGALENPLDPNELAVARDRYLFGKTPTLYAERLLGVLENLVRERS